MMNLTLLLVALVAGGNGDQKATYAIDTKGSTVEWFGGNVTGKTHNGTLSFEKGEITVSGEKLVGGNFTVDMNSMTCIDLGEGMAAKLVGHLKSDDFFSVATYPTATLEIKKVGKGANGAAQITAALSIKGKVEEVTFPALLQMQGDNLMATAELTFDRAKFDVRYGSGSFFDNLGDKAIKDEIKIVVKIKATKTAS